MEKLTAQQIQLILKRRGYEISLEEAALVLDFIRRMAAILVSNHFDKKT